MRWDFVQRRTKWDLTHAGWKCLSDLTSTQGQMLQFLEAAPDLAAADGGIDECQVTRDDPVGNG
jgi:hypothetical protein